MNKKELGQVVQKLRQNKGMTVRQLGEKSGVIYSNISKLENGKYNASIDVLNNILRHLDAELTITCK